MAKLIATLQKACLRGIFRLFEPKNCSSFAALCKAPLWTRQLLERMDERKCIFVHIPRCAGMSISQSLFGCKIKGHRSIQEFQNIFPPKIFDEYFKFSIVRNPWDRLVSSFFFLKNGGMNRWDKKWSDLNLVPFKDFDSFVLGWLSIENTMTWFPFVPQYHYIYLKNGKMPLDFMGCYENLDADFAYICHRLNIKPELGRLNSSRHEHYDYRKYYTEETRRIVAEVYADDIRILGYSFDSLPPRICKEKDLR